MRILPSLGSASGALQQPLRRLDVHSLDHLGSEPLGATVEGFHQSLRTLDLSRTRCKGPMARLNLVRVNQALAVEAEAAPVLRLPQKTLCIFEAIEHTIEGRNTARAGGKHNQLERG